MTTQTATLDDIIPLVEKLSLADQAKLLEIVSATIHQYVVAITLPEPAIAPATAEAERQARVRAFRGKYRNSLSPVDEFLRMKHEDNEREDGRWNRLF